MWITGFISTGNSDYVNIRCIINQELRLTDYREVVFRYPKFQKNKIRVRYTIYYMAYRYTLNYTQYNNKHNNTTGLTSSAFRDLNDL